MSLLLVTEESLPTVQYLPVESAAGEPCQVPPRAPLLPCNHRGLPEWECDPLCPPSILLMDMVPHPATRDSAM